MWKTGVPRCDGCGAEIKSPSYPRKDPELKMVFCGPRCRAHYLLAKTAKLAGYVSALLVILLCFPVRGEAESHHPLHDFYKTWNQPGTTTSCCNARREVNGEEYGDCEPAPSELRGKGQTLAWWVYIRQIREWQRVPDEKIIRERNPDTTGQNAHLCWTPLGGILCFVPKTGLF